MSPSSPPDDPCPVSPTYLPDNFNFATSVVDYWAKKSPSQLALHWTDQTLTQTRELTYAHFSQRSHRIARFLTETLEIKQGETCILILPRIPEWWEIATACLRAGIIMCPCTTLLVDKDIEYRLQVSHASVFVGDEVAVGKVLKVKEGCPQLRKIVQIGGAGEGKNVMDFHSELSKMAGDVPYPTPNTLTSTSPALIFFTSGTTGPPKMVLHTQTSYPLAHALTGIHWLRLTPKSTYWNLSEQGWAKAAWSFFATWNCGATLFVHDDRLAFNPKRTLEVLAKFPITTLCAPPTVYRQLVLDESRRLFASKAGRPKALVHACGAGEPLNESVIRVWKETTGGMEICDGYGQTETILICANQKANAVKPGSMGKPIPDVPLKVIDTTGAEAKDDEEGDIALEIDEQGQRGRAFFGLFEGYIDMKSGKLDRRIKRAGNKSYYVTGDRATRDADGYFWFVGRSDDVINSSGYRIGPFEVESTLKLHPSVVESAVVAAPDPDRDEVVKAFVVLTEAAAAALKEQDGGQDKLIKELQDFCKQNAAPYKYPRKMEFVDAAFLPKTISGKIKRAELKKLERERYQKAQGSKL